MLVLARKLDQKIVIDGGRIVITVVGWQGKDKVRLGIEAPEDMVIDREEIHRARQQYPRAKGGG